MAFGFAPSGRVFVAEKAGRVKSFDSIDDGSATTIIDIENNVNSYADRGLLGLAVDPAFGAGSDYLYLLYTLDLGDTFNDDCADGLGAGCVVNGRLSRYPISGQSAGAEQILLEGFWCQQFPSHSIADLAFDQNGYLLVSAGDGASFGFADHGQNGNPCADPMGGASQTDNEGGALRSLDLLGSGNDPISYDGTILRIIKTTGAPAPGNPLIGVGDTIDDRIIAYGLRNPFRLTTRPGTSEIWVGDVGWGTWEEVNRIQNPGGSGSTEVENFGWPCYEGNNTGSAIQPGYDGLDVNICEGLYPPGPPDVVAPHYAYQHLPANSHDGCAGTGGAISGMTFYSGDRYPSQYQGALFFADYSIRCIRVMLKAGSGGVPDKNQVSTLISPIYPVDMQTGPDGDVFYADIAFGTIVRLVYNTGPTAVINAAQTTGSIPLTVDFSGAASTDGQDDPLTYAWDLDGDGAYDDSTVVDPQWTYNSAGQVTVRLRVTDPFDESDIDTIVINPVANQAPVADITAPDSSFTWQVGTNVSFNGTATDPVDGALGPDAMEWDIILAHCPLGGCHEHPYLSFDAVASGQFVAPDHEYPSHLILRLTVTDAGGLTDTDEVQIYPQTSVLTFETVPAGLELVIGQTLEGTPYSIEGIIGGTMSVSAPATQVMGGATYNFLSWSDGGAASHDITVPAIDGTLTATYQLASGGGGGGGGSGGGGGGGGAPPSLGFDDVGSDHPYYRYISWLAELRITLGCAENLFCPDSPVTRAQMASFLVRAFAIPRADSDQFIDIEGSVHEADINALVARGITRGCAEDRFCPDDPMTRGQMAAFLVRTFFLPRGPDLFLDDENSQFENDINALAQSGITLGCGPGLYCPDAVVTRAEMAAFLFRAYDR